MNTYRKFLRPSKTRSASASNAFRKVLQADIKSRQALASADWIKTVAHVPTEFVLLSDSQDIQACLDSVGSKVETPGCLFALVGDGEYLAVYACAYAVPMLQHSVSKLFPRD